jgi:hypothetical protein
MGGIVAAETLFLLANDQPLTAPSSSSTMDSNSNFPSNTTLSSTTGTSRPSYNAQSTFKSPSSSSKTKSSTHDINSGPTAMFPQIIGLLSFDTPFLGVSPGVIAHGAEGHYRTASSAYSAFSELSSAFGWGGAAGASKSSSTSNSGITTPAGVKSSQPAGLLTNGNDGDAAATPRWQSWGKYAMFAGAAGAVAAGGAAALYSQREKLTSGWGWISGHLEFVGCLLRGEELKSRVERVGALSNQELVSSGQKKSETKNGRENRNSGKFSRVQGTGNGFQGSAQFYTILGRGANTGGVSGNTGTKILADSIAQKRTFCKLPQSLERKNETNKHPQKSIKTDSTGIENQTQTETGGLIWLPALNDKATDEITAHTSMFYPRENPGFYSLGEKAKEIVVGWVQRQAGWYESCQEERPSSNPKGRARGNGKATTTTGAAAAGGGETEHVWVQPHDAEDQDEDVRMRDGSVDAEDLERSVVVDKAPSS